jgi:plastocyanin
MNAKRPTIAALVAVAVVGLSGCGSSSDDKAADAGPTTPTHSMTMTPPSPSGDSPSTTSDDNGGMGDMVMVDIKDFMYKGAMSVKPGQMVMVTNDDAEAHTLTSDDSGMFAVTVQPGATAMFDAPTKPGSYAYHCDFHANMHGSLVVT